ncbi:hypothetical protein AAEO56_17990 [Flavobacterium sp. DGU11]|uniref:Uncharacterized protein n=1 Tax=Flavobacterium arundinis TaxID=3139143 RepID=A0ABU9I180_9FLAO
MENTAVAQNSDAILFINAIGVMYTDRVIIPAHSAHNPIYYKDLRRVQIIKRQIKTVNIAGFVLCIAVCLIAAMVNYSIREKALILVYALPLLAVGIFYKNVRYKIILEYKDQPAKSFQLQKTLKPDAKNFIVKINKVLRKK